MLQTFNCLSKLGLDWLNLDFSISKTVALKTRTESLQNLLICHFGLLPLAVSVTIHSVGRVLRLDLRLRWSQHFFHGGGRLWWVHDRACVDLQQGKRKVKEM